MRLGMFTRVFSAVGARPSLEAVAGAGFAATQFNLTCLGLDSVMPERIESDDAKAIAEASQETGVEIVTVQGTYNMIHPDPEVRRTGKERLEVICAACADMGTDMVAICTGTRDPDDLWTWHPDNATPEAWKDVLSEVGAAIEIAERYGVRLAVEPELGNVVSSAARARQLIDELRTDSIRIALDPANLYESGPDEERRSVIERSIELLAGDIALTHAKDRDASGKFTTAGKGVVDFRHFVRTLKANGVDVPILAHGLNQVEATDVAVFLRQVVDLEDGNWDHDIGPARR